MILCYFLKLLTECSLYFVCANCLVAIALVEIDSFFPALICAAVGTLAFWMEEKHSKQRFLVMPLLALVFLFAKGFGTTIVLFLPALYVALCIKEKRYFVDAETQSTLFRFGIIVAFVCYFLFAVFVGVRWVVPFILLFLFANILLMRLLRQNPATLNDKRYLLNNALRLGGTLVVTALLTSKAVIQLIANLWGQIYTLLIEPLTDKISAFLYHIFGKWMDLLFNSIFTGIKHSTQKNTWRGGEFHDEAFYSRIEEAMNQESPAVLFILLVCLIVGIILVRQYVRTSRKGRNIQRQASVREKRQIITEQRPEDKIPLDLIAPKDPRLAVRFYYRKFLNLCKKLEYQFPESFTTKQIENSVSRRFGKEPTRNIRQTYIRARYSSKEITEADVTAMKEQVNELREQYEPKKSKN